MNDSSIWKQVVRLAWPVWAQQLLMWAVVLYDQYLAGNNAPEDPAEHVAYQAAQTTANYLTWFIANFSALVAVGATALVARFTGAKQPQDANRVLHQAMMMAAGLGICGTKVGYTLLPTLVHLMDLHGTSAVMATEYLQPIFLLLTFQLIEQAGIACLIGAGDTRPSLWVLGGVALLNMPLANLCFHGIGSWHGFGFIGIALGTALSHSVGSCAVVALLLRGRAGLLLRPGALIPDLDLIRRLLRISMPASLDTLSLGLCQLWFLRLINQVGVVAAAAHGIAIRVEGLGYLSGYAFATAAGSLVGRNLGARKFPEAVRSGWMSLLIGVGAMGTMGLIFFTFAPQLFRLFCPEDQQLPVIREGVPVLRLVAFAMPPLAAIIIFTGALRGAGDTRVPVLITWFGFLVIRIPLAYFLIFPSIDLGWLGTVPGLGQGLFGAWLAMFADLLVRGCLFIWRFAGGRWKQAKV